MASKKQKKNKGKKTNQAKAKSTKKTTSIRKLSTRQKGFLALILVASFIVFSPSLKNSHVNWDDDRNYYENELITELNSENFWANTKEIFKTPVIGNYNPLSIWTFAIEKSMWGLNETKWGQPSLFYWHLDNILLHLACIFFVFLICHQLKLPFAVQLLVTVLFAVHPMRVESVSWLTERKDVLFGVFYLAAMHAYLLYIQRGKKKKYIIWLWVCFILSLFSKIQAVILPISLILIDYWFDGKLIWKKMISKLPYFLASFVFGLIGIYFLKDQGSLETSSTFAFWERIFVGSYSYFIYLVKSIVPFRLSPLYPYPASLPTYFYPSILMFFGVAYALWTAYKKQWKVIFFGLGFFTANIFFLLQILGAGQGFLADRFTYIAYLGLFIIIAHFLIKFLDKFLPKKHIHLIFILPLIIYGGMSFQQTKIWKNSGTLWTHVLKYYKKSTLPYGNRANYYRDNGEKEKALVDYNATIRLDKTRPQPYNSRGRLYFNYQAKDSLLKALNDYNTAIDLDPKEAEYYVNRGAVYARLNNMDKALENFNKGIELDNQFLNAYLNRSIVFGARGQNQKALEDILHYLQYKPYVPDLQFEAGKLYNVLNKYNEALPHFNQAIKLNPNKGLYYIDRAKAYYSTNQASLAQADIQRAQQLGQKIPDKVFNQIMRSN